MSSTLGSILSAARSALMAQQTANQVTAHNIANANTDGYSRQEVSLATSTPVKTPYGVLGTGVQVTDITRHRDSLLDVAYRRESSAAGDYRMRHELLTQVEATFGEISEDGLGASFDRFWSSWSDLANNPSNPAARGAVRETGRQIAGAFNRLDAGLDDVARYAQDRLSADVDRFNGLSQSIAELNQRIVAAESGGATAGDLRDARDLALDEMAGLLPTQVVERENGGAGVSVGGVGVVDGASAQTLQLEKLGTTWSLQTATGTAVPAEGGSVGAAIDVLGTELPERRGALDALAAALVDSVNDLHRQGVSPAHAEDPTLGPIDFFDPSGTNARTIGLSAEIDADDQAIAAGIDDGTGEYRSGANDLALALAQLRDDTDTMGTRSFGETYADLVADVGFAVVSSDESASVHETLVDQSQARRTSVSGVSIDEELVQLIQTQAAFGAAARVVNSVDDMLQTLLTMA